MQRIQRIRTVRLDGVQALKRAFLHRGFVFKRTLEPPQVIPQPDSKTTLAKPKPALKRVPQPDESPKKPKTAKPKPKSREEPPQESGETYPERVAEGESDEAIESEDKDLKAKDKLKSQAEGSKTATGPENLEELTAKSQDILYEATTAWPFTLFPDTITLDREKLTIANRFFWRVANITSVPVGEIMSAEVIVGPFFGSLHLTFRFFANNERTLNFLWRKDAVEIQRLIHGYIIAHRREIDVTSVKKDELIALLTELGQGASD
jgi:hypothetical protein